MLRKKYARPSRKMASLAGKEMHSPDPVIRSLSADVERMRQNPRHRPSKKRVARKRDYKR